LVEAVALSVFGDASGIVTGFIASFGIPTVLHWPPTISITAVGLALGIAAITGVLFGFYPAQRSSLLSPIDALRDEQVGGRPLSGRGCLLRVHAAGKADFIAPRNLLKK
jgi:hypothetical protein